MKSEKDIIRQWLTKQLAAPIDLPSESEKTAVAQATVRGFKMAITVLLEEHERHTSFCLSCPMCKRV